MEARIQKYVRAFLDNPNYELEVQFDRFNVTQFARLLETLKQRMIPVEGPEEKLSISFKRHGIPLRYEITGHDDIQAYLNFNKLNDVTPPVLVVKMDVPRMPPVHFNGRYSRLSLKLERPEDFATVGDADFAAATKHYRLKRRTSFMSPNGAFRFDITAVRSSVRDAKTLEASGLLDAKNQEHYEVEMEFMRQSDPAAYRDVMTFVDMIADYKRNEDALGLDVLAASAAQGDAWVLPNRVGFLPWAYHRFHPDQYTVPPPQTNADDTLRLFPHQQLIQDYMQYDSPYRGLLLYHGLGVGKSCASIAAGEGFLQRGRKIYVMVPASLETNYRTEISRCASEGNPRQKLWTELRAPSKAAVTAIAAALGMDIKFVQKHRDGLWIPGILPKDVPVSAIARTGVRWMDLAEAERTAANATMTYLINTKFTFIRYNGVTNRQIDELGARPFDDAFVVMDEAHNFISRVVNGSKLARRLYNMMIDAAHLKIVLLSGTPIINHPFELCSLLNLVRGPMTQYEFGLLKSANIPAVADIVDALGEYSGIVDTLMVKPEERKIILSLLPEGYVRSSEYHVTKGAWPSAAAIGDIHDILQRRFKVGKKLGTEDVYALPSTKEEFNTYFLDETDIHKPMIKNEDMFMRRVIGTVSYFRSAGEAHMPTVLPREIEKVPMSEFQFSRYVRVRDKERPMERNNGVMGNKISVYRAFSRMMCNFTFPDDIKRKFPKDIRRALATEITVGEDDAAADDGAAADAAAKKIAAEAKKKYDDMLGTVMHQLETSTDVLDKRHLKTAYSPKFAKIVDHIMTSPGSVLLYSQFRTVEGLGIMRLVLQKAGFAEINVEKRDGTWAIIDAERVLDPVYDGKRYVVFSEDREKTNVLLRIFNGQAGDDVPAVRGRSNLYGDVARVMMITQSGAEGISLRNVRRVLITEPFWNMVRMNQIIGRAVRTGSHLDLPAADRNVQVFIYTAAFTKEQLKSNFTLQRQDGSMTSDEHIMDVAERKDQITRGFLNMLKQAAVDCLSNADDNRPLANGLKCYAFPVSLEPEVGAFMARIEDDTDMARRYSGRVEKVERLHGRVVSRNGKKYVMVDGRTGLFDYRAWKEGGILVDA